MYTAGHRKKRLSVGSLFEAQQTQVHPKSEEIESFVAAAQQGDVFQMKLFAGNNAELWPSLDVRARPCELNALHAAVISQQHEAVQWLIEHDANVRDRNPSSGRIVLHNACARSDAKMVQLLLAHGTLADLNVLSDDGLSAMDYAKQWEKHDIVHLLQAYGAIEADISSAPPTPQTANPSWFSLDLASMGSELYSWAMSDGTPAAAYSVFVSVQTADGSSTDFMLEQQQGGSLRTISDVKAKIEEAQGVAPSLQELFFLGVIGPDVDAVDDSGMTSSSLSTVAASYSAVLSSSLSWGLSIDTPMPMTMNENDAEGVGVGVGLKSPQKSTNIQKDEDTGSPDPIDDTLELSEVIKGKQR
jgi:hypothetical protein